jgi:glycosyltransferase involved in cell wall biosynthesis
MDSADKGRIGIFEYDWSMYSFIRDLAIKLTESGYTVDIFHKDPNFGLDFTNIELFKHNSNVRYINFRTSNTLSCKIARKIKKFLGKLSRNYLQNPKNIIDREILLKSKRIVAKSKYQCFIGVEKSGLIWAGMLAQLYGYPLIYYSLELYLEDHPDIDGYSHLRKAEKKYHQLSRATIIQDRARADALMKHNEIGTTDLIYFPISVRGDVVENKSCFFYQKYKIKETQQILLYFGLIQDERFSTDLVRIASLLKDTNKLVLHGFGEQTYLDYLQSIADKNRVLFSLDFVPEEKIIEVISSAAIGLALYPDTSSNDRLVAFSSVKMAYYMQCGIPVIAFDSESFRELINAYKCGELINSIDEIPQKVEKILSEYESYRKQAFMAFRQFYDFDKNFNKFNLDLERFIKNGCVAEKRILDEDAWEHTL